MTNDLTLRQAIEELEAMREHIEDGFSVCGATAYDMGIEALKVLEAQPTDADCISREELIKQAFSVYYPLNGESYIKVILLEDVEKAPIATKKALEAQPTDAKESIIKSALKYLVKMQIEQGGVGFAVDNDPDHDCCWDDVLAWIEAQPTDECEDVGSPWCLGHCPYRNEPQPCVDAVSRKEAIACCRNEWEEEVKERLRALPSVTPQRKIGKWIKHIERRGAYVGDTSVYSYVCSSCDYKTFYNEFGFCPNCGAEMEDSDEVSD